METSNRSQAHGQNSEGSPRSRNRSSQSPNENLVHHQEDGSSPHVGEIANSLDITKMTRRNAGTSSIDNGDETHKLDEKDEVLREELYGTIREGSTDVEIQDGMLYEYDVEAHTVLEKNKSARPIKDSNLVCTALAVVQSLISLLTSEGIMELQGRSKRPEKLAHEAKMDSSGHRLLFHACLTHLFLDDIASIGSYQRRVQDQDGSRSSTHSFHLRPSLCSWTTVPGASQ